MRIITTFLLLAFLTGCAIAPNYDSNEYKIIVDMRELASDPYICKDNNDASTVAYMLVKKAKYLNMYSEFLPRNEIAVQMIIELENFTTEFHAAYEGKEPSQRYCERKLEIILHNIITIQKITGHKPDR